MTTNQHSIDTTVSLYNIHSHIDTIKSNTDKQFYQQAQPIVTRLKTYIDTVATQYKTVRNRYINALNTIKKHELSLQDAQKKLEAATKDYNKLKYSVAQLQYEYNTTKQQFMSQTELSDRQIDLINTLKEQVSSATDRFNGLLDKYNQHKEYATKEKNQLIAKLDSKSIAETNKSMGTIIVKSTDKENMSLRMLKDKNRALQDTIDEQNKTVEQQRREIQRLSKPALNVLNRNDTQQMKYGSTHKNTSHKSSKH